MLRRLQPSRGGTPAAQAVLSAEVQLPFFGTVTAAPFGRDVPVRVLVVTSAQRGALMPDAPTIAESGVPGFQASMGTALPAPAGTTEPALRRLSEIRHQGRGLTAARRARRRSRHSLSLLD